MKRRSVHARRLSRIPPSASVERQVEIPLPSALRKDRLQLGSSVALVDIEGERLKLRFLRTAAPEDEAKALTEAEQMALARGGVTSVSDVEARLAHARAAAEYQGLCATSLSVEEAAVRLDVNPSRIRQRLAERSLFGLKDGNAWLLPAFQFQRAGLVSGVDAVFKRLPSDISPLAVARWFGIPNPDLATRDHEETPLTPLQWLQSGNSHETAAELAAAL